MSNPTNTSSGKDRVQAFGRFLSAMVMPNIGAFIAWGLITALFIKTGWLPVPALGGFEGPDGTAHTGLVGPMISYLLPLFIAYSGGRLVADHRGGVLGAIAAMGVIVGSSIPMFIGAMIMGPLGGWVIKKFDDTIGRSVPTGFEMLVNNFSAGILGMLLAIAGFYAIGPAVEGFTALVSAGVEMLVNRGLLPLVSLFIEPGKILFLNNAINHGLLTPLGTAQSQEFGRSVYFLLEANPGPGAGVLLAYWMFAKGAIRSSAPGAFIIHFLGGIHEIYFPYVLMRPALLLAVIAGGMAGIATLVALGGGLVSAASPGSIFAILAMTPQGAHLANVAAVLVAAAVSFGVSAVVLRGATFSDDDLAAAQSNSKAMKGGVAAAGLPPVNTLGDLDAAKVEKIVFACDAGMGSSAMGASAFRQKVNAARIPVVVTNTSIENIPADADVVVTQNTLTSRALKSAPTAHHISIDNFMSNPVYNEFVDALKAAKLQPEPAAPAPEPVAVVVAAPAAPAVESDVLQAKNVKVGLPSVSRREAIVAVGKALVASGHVEPNYIDAMLRREELTTTYLGNGVATPHGTDAAKANVLSSGIVVHQYPGGVDFEGQKAHLVIGIAGKDGGHMNILSKLATVLGDEATAERLGQTTDADELYRALSQS